MIAAAEELEEEVTPAEIREMINWYDLEGQGKISLEAFISFNKRKNFDWIPLSFYTTSIISNNLCR